MTEGQILLDCRAFEQMQHQSSQVVERYKDAFRDQPNGDQFEKFLKKVGSMSTQCLNMFPTMDITRVMINSLFLSRRISLEIDVSPRIIVLILECCFA